MKKEMKTMDIHDYTAIKRFGDNSLENRRKAKAANFAVLCGTSKPKIEIILEKKE